MAIASLSDLKVGHLYKYNSGQYSTYTDANSRLIFKAVGKVNTNLTLYPSYSATQYLGRTSSAGLASFYYSLYSYVSVFHGEFYFVFDSYEGTPTNLLSYIEEVKDFFVTDRTQADVDYAKSIVAVANSSLKELKGCLNAFDLARIESNIYMIREDIVDYGFNVPAITSKFDWTINNFLTSSDVTRIIGNIQTLVDNFIVPTGWIALPTTMKTYQDINIIEQDLKLLRENIDILKNAFLKAGTFNTYTRNNEYNILPLKN